MLQNEPAISQGWLRALLYLMAFLAVMTAAQLVAIPFILLLPGFNLESLGEIMGGSLPLVPILIMYLFVCAGTLLITWVFTNFIDKQLFKDLGFELKGRGKDIVLGLAGGAILIGIGFIILKSLGMLKVTAIQWVPAKIAGYLALTLLVALMEEIALRGYILHNLMQSINKWGALAITSFIFMIMHGINPNISLLAVLNLFLAGIFIGVYYIHQKNLWFPIFIHLSWNFFQGPVFGFEVSGMKMDEGIIVQEVNGAPIWTGGDFGFEGSVILTALLILGSIGLHFYASKGKTNH